MGGFAGAAGRHARAAWHAVAVTPTVLVQGRREYKREPLGKRTKTGCLGTLVFGVGWFLVPLMLGIAATLAVVAYALLVSLVWGLALLVERVTKREKAPEPIP